MKNEVKIAAKAAAMIGAGAFTAWEGAKAVAPLVCQGVDKWNEKKAAKAAAAVEEEDTEVIEVVEPAAE